MGTYIVMASLASFIILRIANSKGLIENDTIDKVAWFLYSFFFSIIAIIHVICAKSRKVTSWN